MMTSTSNDTKVSQSVMPDKAGQPEDYGFFGPDSITWRVWRYPTSLTIGFQRAVVIEELDPFLIAPVYSTQKIVKRARTRYDNTLKYFATVAFGDARSVVKAADMLVRIHSRIVGVEPVSGLRFDANNPDSQLWIHMTAWHSILYAYEVYGPGKLSEEDEALYWHECAIAAEFQTCSPDAVPRTREGVRQYFEQMRPRMAASIATQEIMDHLLNADVMFPPVPWILRPGAWVANKLLRAATLATMPRWQRNLAGMRQWNMTGAIVRTLGRLVFRSFALLASNKLQLSLLGLISPATKPVVEHVFLDIAPQDKKLLSPAEASAHFETPSPVERYSTLRMSPEMEKEVVYSQSSAVPV